MKKIISRLVPQPLTAFVMCALALAVLAGAWFNTPRVFFDSNTIQTSLVALGLAAAVVVAGLYPIHIQNRTKVVLTTPPLYLAATLLPPGIAALTAAAIRSR